MNSSMRRWAQLRSERVMDFMVPNSSNWMTGSGRSKSMEPRRWRLWLRISASCFIRSKVGDEVGEFGAGASASLSRMVWTCGVGHAARGADDAFADLVVEDFAAGVDFHEAEEDEAVFAGAQAADVGRELLREHGDGAVGEVDGVAAEAGFEVERGAGRDVVGDVGDVDLKMPVAGCWSCRRGRRRRSRGRFRRRW